MVTSKRPRRLNYAVDKKRSRSVGKLGKALNHLKKLEKRIAFEGETLWLKNAVLIVTKKLKKYGIKIN